MSKLWNYLQNKSLSLDNRRKIFLFINIVVCVALSVYLCLLVGLFIGIDATWLEMTIILTGYLAFGVGFLGGCIFLMRNT